MRRRPRRQNLKDIREGQRQAREAVVCQNYKAIYRLMTYLTGDANLAEDLTQETFAYAWANIDKFKGRASLKTWLHRIAYNKFIDFRRGFKRQTALADNLKLQQRDTVESSGPLSRVIVDEHSRLLYEAMCELRLSEYLLIVLHYIQGLSYREMARVLDEPVGTVKCRTSGILKKLRASLIGRI